MAWWSNPAQQAIHIEYLCMTLVPCSPRVPRPLNACHPSEYSCTILRASPKKLDFFQGRTPPDSSPPILHLLIGAGDFPGILALNLQLASALGTPRSGSSGTKRRTGARKALSFSLYLIAPETQCSGVVCMTTHGKCTGIKRGCTRIQKGCTDIKKKCKGIRSLNRIFDSILSEVKMYCSEGFRASQKH